MGYVTVNFSDVEDFEPLPEDEYAVEIEKVEVRMNKAGDGQYLNWEMTVLDGDYENRRLWMITSLKPTALFRLKQVLEELDVLEGDEEMELEYDDDVEVDRGSGPRLLFPEVEGLEAIAVIKNEMYDGKERNRVESLYTEGRKKSKKKSNKRVDSDNQQIAKARSKSRRREEEEDDDEDEQEVRPRRQSSSSRSGGRRKRLR